MPNESAKPYRVVTENHVIHYDVALQESIPGWEVKALWLATGTIIPVFVPDSNDLNAGVDLLVRAKGEEIDRLRSSLA